MVDESGTLPNAIYSNLLSTVDDVVTFDVVVVVVVAAGNIAQWTMTTVENQQIARFGTAPTTRRQQRRRWTAVEWILGCLAGRCTPGVCSGVWLFDDKLARALRNECRWYRPEIEK